jgi:hypothetical protein
VYFANDSARAVAEVQTTISPPHSEWQLSFSASVGLGHGAAVGHERDPAPSSVYLFSQRHNRRRSGNPRLTATTMLADTPATPLETNLSCTASSAT